MTHSIKSLRFWRIALSLVLFAASLLLFTDVHHLLPQSFFRVFTFLQFSPSLVGFLREPAVLASGFLVVLLLTLLVGRVYCAGVCPLGVMQDVVIRLRSALGRKRRFLHTPPRHMMRTLFIVLFAGGLAATWLPLVALLDPFSVFGRIAAGLFRWVVSGFNNLAATLLETSDLYGLPPAQWPIWVPVFFVLTAGQALLVLSLAWFRGRLFCNTLCPVGVLLGFFSRWSLFRLRIDHKSCNHCGACETVCKASCLSSADGTIDYSRCVACFNCTSACNRRSIGWSRPKIASPDARAPHSPSRRAFFRNTLTATTLVPILARSGSKNNSKNPVSPPGSVSNQRLTERCTACHVCIAACPSGVLKPSLGEYGLEGFFLPMMDYRKSFCNYSCTTCTRVCPSGALTPLEVAEKKALQLGKAVFDADLCIVKTKGTACGACSEHCPTKAVQMVPYKGKLKIPEVNARICVGCGACEFACPVTPRSIFVESNPLHLRALPPVKTIRKKEKVPVEDFPF